MPDFGRYGDARYEDRARYRDETLYRDRDAPRDTDRRGFFGGGRNDRGWIGRNSERERPGSGEAPMGRSSRSSAWDRDSRYGRDWDRDETHYGYDDHHRGLPINETEQLIASNKVEGTPVYGREGERLGTIYNFMVDKYSGQVEYAVMAFGGFLGVGQRYYPMPWRILSYDIDEGGYRVDLDYRDLERAPSFGRNDEPRFNRDYGRRVHSWYGLDY